VEKDAHGHAHGPKAEPAEFLHPSRSDAFTDRRSNYGTIRAGSHEQARSALKDLAATYVALNKLIDAQLARLS